MVTTVAGRTDSLGKVQKLSPPRSNALLGEGIPEDSKLKQLLVAEDLISGPRYGLPLEKHLEVVTRLLMVNRSLNPEVHSTTTIRVTAIKVSH